MGIFRSRRKRTAVRAGARSLVSSAYHIEFQNVWKKLGGHEILRGVDLKIQRGETFVIIGQSGTGKSVTLKHIIGLMQPDYGRVLISGVDRTKLTERERLESYKQFGYLFQSGALINWMTIYENVALPLREHTTLPEAEIKKRVCEKLEMVNLGQHGEKYPSEVSGGMKKRAGLARAIVREPEILLYDEPTSGLDPVMSREVDRLIIKLARELQVTNVLVTHDMESAYLCADRIGMLYKGRMLQIGTPEEIRDSRDPVVQAFITGGVIPTEPDAQVALPSQEVQARRTRQLTQLRRTRASKRESAVEATEAEIAREAAATTHEPSGQAPAEVREAEPASDGSASSEPTRLMERDQLAAWPVESVAHSHGHEEGPTKAMSADELQEWPEDLRSAPPASAAETASASASAGEPLSHGPENESAKATELSAKAGAEAAQPPPPEEEFAPECEPVEPAAARESQDPSQPGAAASAPAGNGAQPGHAQPSNSMPDSPPAEHADAPGSNGTTSEPAPTPDSREASATPVTPARESDDNPESGQNAPTG